MITFDKPAQFKQLADDVDISQIKPPWFLPTFRFSLHVQIFPPLLSFLFFPPIHFPLLMQISSPHLSPHSPSHHPSSIPLLTLTLTLPYLPLPTLVYGMPVLGLRRVNSNPTIISLTRPIHTHPKPSRLRLHPRRTLGLVRVMSIVTVCSCLCKPALGSNLG